MESDSGLRHLIGEAALVNKVAFLNQFKPLPRAFAEVLAIATGRALPVPATPVSGARPPKRGILQNVPGDFREKARGCGMKGPTGD